MSPFDGFDEQDAELLDRNAYLQLHRPAPPLSRFRRRLPAGFVALVEACLRPEPQDRPSTLELWRALQEVLAQVEPDPDEEP